MTHGVAKTSRFLDFSCRQSFFSSWVRPIRAKCNPVSWILSAGLCYDFLVSTSSKRNVFVTLYCLAIFFQNFGPNTITFIVSGELYPTRYRSTGHGIAAASGKMGAVVVQLLICSLRQHKSSSDDFIKKVCVPLLNCLLMCCCLS